MRVFEKRKYEGEPDMRIRHVVEKLAVLGKAIVAVRGIGFSANLTGCVYIGKDGDDPVVSVAGCGCHVHVMWDKVHDYVLGREDVGHGFAEPVVYLIDKDGEPVINLFYPEKGFEEIQALLE